MKKLLTFLLKIVDCLNQSVSPTFTKDATGCVSDSNILIMSNLSPENTSHSIPNMPIYTDLDKCAQQIRLLKVLSVEPAIQAELETVSLHDQPTFDALSYVWGTEENQATIDVSDSSLLINRNLHDALRDIYHQWAVDAPGSAHTRRLSVDAICINQRDDVEKNHQLPLMQQIYSSAKNVFAWLGVPDAELPWVQNFDQAFKTLHTIADELSAQGMTLREPKPAASSGDRTEYDAWMGNFPDIFDYDDFTVDAKRDPFVARMLYGREKLPSLPWDGIIALMDQPYWTRVWIFQEIYLAHSRITFISGTNSLPFSKMENVLEWLGGLVAQPSKPRHMSQALWIAFSFGVGAGFDLFQVLNALLSIDEDIGKLADDINPKEDKCALRRLRTEHHAILVSTLMGHSFRASDCRDYVWGLLGVSKLDIETNYEHPETESWDVPSLDLVRCWLDVSQNREDHLIPRSCPWSLQDLWFLDFALANVTDMPITALNGEHRWRPFIKPSPTARNNLSQHLHDPSCRVPVLQQIFHGTLSTWGIKDGNILEPEGVMIDQIGQFGPAGPENDFHLDGFWAKPEEHRDLEFYWWFMDYLLANPKYPTGEHCSISMERALLSNEDPESLSGRRDSNPTMLFGLLLGLKDGNAGAEAAKNPVLQNLVKDLTNHFGEEIFRPFEYEYRKVTYASGGLQSYPFYYQHQGADHCVALAPKKVTTTYQGMKQALFSACERRIGATARSYVGRFLTQSDTGDEVWLLAGYNHPVILRRVGNHHILVGSAEIVEPLGGRAKEEIIDLRSKIQRVEIY